MLSHITVALQVHELSADGAVLAVQRPKSQGQGQGQLSLASGQGEVQGQGITSLVMRRLQLCDSSVVERQSNGRRIASNGSKTESKSIVTVVSSTSEAAAALFQHFQDGACVMAMIPDIPCFKTQTTFSFTITSADVHQFS